MHIKAVYRYLIYIVVWNVSVSVKILIIMTRTFKKVSEPMHDCVSKVSEPMHDCVLKCFVLVVVYEINISYIIFLKRNQYRLVAVN